MKQSSVFVCALVAGGVSMASAQVQVTGGQTSVLLDLDTLDAAASLALTGVSGDVVMPGGLGIGSVAFPINARDGSLPTTFEYTPGTLAPFSGTIEHTGTVTFNDPINDQTDADDVTVGNFTIGFDAGRVDANRSGFFVQDTFALNAILFDVGTPTSLVATGDELTIGADLLVSPEFAQTLLDLNFATADLTGADVGDALVQAVPAPGGAAMLAMGGLVAARRRRG